MDFSYISAITRTNQWSAVCEYGAILGQFLHVDEVNWRLIGVEVEVVAEISTQSFVMEDRIESKWATVLALEGVACGGAVRVGAYPMLLSGGLSMTRFTLALGREYHSRHQDAVSSLVGWGRVAALRNSFITDSQESRGEFGLPTGADYLFIEPACNPAGAHWSGVSVSTLGSKCWIVSLVPSIQRSMVARRVLAPFIRRHVASMWPSIYTKGLPLYQVYEFLILNTAVVQEL